MINKKTFLNLREAFRYYESLKKTLPNLDKYPLLKENMEDVIAKLELHLMKTITVKGILDAF